jgi:hypothetical protein
MHLRLVFALAATAALTAFTAGTTSSATLASAVSAKGDVTWFIPLPNAFGVEVDNQLSFNVRKDAQGTVRGRVDYAQTVEHETFRFEIDATCFNVYDGNRAKIGGLVTHSNDPTVPPGTFGWFQVFDLGDGVNPPLDRSSLLGFGDEAANEAFCSSPNLPRFGPWDVHGNIRVRA